MKLRPLFLALSLGFLTAGAATAETVAWQIDPPAAMATAKTEKKLVLMNFTGSDWCVWCHRLEDEVFARPEFQAYANENLVLLRLDFPRQKPQLPHLKRQYEKLSEMYQVTGYPTIVITDGDGNEVARTGYMHGGAKTFVRFLKAARTEAKAAEGK